MSREELVLESFRFTTTSALAREIVALLENSTYKLCIVVKTPREFEELTNELENARTLGRVKLVSLVSFEKVANV